MDAYVGEIRLFAGNFAPKDWALCNGQLIPITQNTALFSILGVTYGGDGKTNFALPNLQGSTILGPGAGPGLTPRTLGQKLGSPTVTLRTNEMPAHNHNAMGYAGQGTTKDADDAVWGQYATTTRPPTQAKLYGPGTDLVPMAPVALNVTGGSQPHNNMQPYLGLNFIICLYGVFPSRP